jgi:riboflavin kinase/FMN adenylyltransferase
MLLLNGFTDPDAYRGGFLSLGNFDGVHRGHQAMLGELIAHARRLGGPAVVMTFEPHPLALIAPERLPPKLTTLDEKARLLAELGIDCLIAYKTDTHLLQLTAEEFFERIIREEIAARGVIEGPNFCFGRGRKGTIDTLKVMCAAAHLELKVCEMIALGGADLSSTTIRTALREGRIRDANTGLGRTYRLTGRVATGARRGRTLGFPTANLDGIETLVPGNGVYAGTSEVNGVRYPAAIHIGPNPTFGENAQKVEIHLVGLQGDLYGMPLSVDFLEHLRGVQRFGSIDELKAQLEQDVARTREIAHSPVPF